MNLFKKILWWFAVPPVVIAFWSFLAAAVHFWDDLEFVLETVNRDTVADFSVKMDALWADYEERMNAGN